MIHMLLQTVALLNLAGPEGAKAGLALGSAVSAGLIIFYLKRAIDTGWYSLLSPACLAVQQSSRQGLMLMFAILLITVFACCVPACVGKVLGQSPIAMMLLFGAEGDPSAWPGPKAWPAALVLVSFFSVNICFQALLKALDPVVLDNVPPLN